MPDWTISRIEGRSSLEHISFQLKLRILTNRLSIGDFLPTVRDLIEATEQEPHVVLDAVNNLVESNVLSWDGEQHVVNQSWNEIIEGDHFLSLQFELFSQIRQHITPRDSLTSGTDEFVAFLRTLLAPTMPSEASDEQPRYIRIRAIARGGMGEIVEAYDSRLHRTIALKMLTMDSDESVFDGSTEKPTGNIRNDAIRRLRFWREMIVTARLEHPSIVPVYDLPDETFGLAYAMKRVAGQTLGDEIRVRPTLSERIELLEHYTNVLNAVAYAHSQGILHRDLKPSNIMIGEFGETYVIDWGLASRIGATEPVSADENTFDWDSELTKTGATLGTPGYAAPEQLGKSNSQVGETADVFALGMVLIAVLSGQRIEEPALLYANSLEREKYLDGLLEIVPNELKAICHKAVRAEPNERYASVLALKRDVDAFRQGRFVDAHEYTFGDRVANQYRRHRVLANATLIALLMVVSISVSSAWRLSNVNTQLSETNLQLQQESVTSNLLLANQYMQQNNWEEARTVLASMPAIVKERWSWRLINTLAHPYENMVHAVDSPMYAMVDSPDPSTFVLLSRSGVFQWRDRATMELLGELKNDQPMKSFSHSQDGSRLVYTGADGITHIVDSASMSVLRSLSVDDVSRSSIRSAAIVTPRRALLGVLEDGNIALWENEADFSPQTIRGDGPFRQVVPSPDGLRFALLRLSAQVCVHNSLNLDAPELVVPGRELRWSDDGSTLMTWDDETIRIFDVRASNPREILSQQITGDRIMDAKVDSQSELAVFIGRDGLMYRADLAASSWLDPLRTDSQILSIFVIQDGLAEISNSNGGVEQWDLNSGSRNWVRQGHSAIVSAVTNGLSQSTIILGDNRGDLIAWNRRRSGAIQTKPLHSDVITSIAVSSDDKRIATLGQDGKINLIDRLTSKVLWSVDSGARVGFSTGGLVFMENDEKIVTVLAGTSIAIIDTATGDVVDTNTHHKHSVSGMVLDDPNAVLYTFSRTEVAKWRAQDLSLISLREFDTGDLIASIGHDPHGGMIFLGLKSGSVVVLDHDTLDRERTFSAHKQMVKAMLVDTNSHELVTAGLDNIINVWRIGDFAKPSAVINLKSMPQSLLPLEPGQSFAVMDSDAYITTISKGQTESTIELPGLARQVFRAVLTQDRSMLIARFDGSLSSIDMK